MSGLSNNTIYRLRIALASPGTNDYFGSTFNGSNWYNGLPSPINYSNFLSITTDNNGSWSGTIQGKVESADPNFSGTSATYDLKVARYTETGSSATWSNILQITVIAPSPSPSPTVTPFPSPTPSPASSNSASVFTISNIPSQINSDQSFTVSINLSMPNNQNIDYYLKGAFKKDDGTRYLGLTKKDSEWIEYGDEYLDQYKITTDSSGNWSGSIEVKPDTLDNDYKGSGDYIFKVGRYTSAGSGPTWSNETTIKINDLNGSPPSSSPTPQSTSKVTSSNSPSPIIFKSPSPKSSYQIASIAGVATSVTPQPEVEIKSQKQINPFLWGGLIFIFAGAGSIGYIYLKKNGRISF